MIRLRTLFLLAVLALFGPPRATSTLYTATSIGPFKTTDGGLTWKQLYVTSNDSPLPGLPMILAIVVAPPMPTTVHGFASYESPSGDRRASAECNRLPEKSSRYISDPDRRYLR